MSSPGGAIAPWRTDAVTIELDDQRVSMRGEIAMRDPVGELQPYLRTIHDWARGAVAGARLELDIRELRFLNSSGIRLFLDWALWIRNDAAEHRYRLVIKASDRHSWQRAALPPILALVGDVVETA